MSFPLLVLVIAGLIMQWQLIVAQISSIPSLAPPPSTASSTSLTTKTVLPLSLLDKTFTLFSWSPPLRMNGDTTGGMMAREIFDFDLEREAILQLIDYKQPGESFQLFDQGRSLGKTAEPKITQDNESVLYADSPESALEDREGRFSKGQVLLKPGRHSISIKILTGSSGPDLSGGALRLIDAPSYRLQRFQRKFEGENSDSYDYDEDKVAVTTITVVVPPSDQGRQPIHANPLFLKF